MNDMLKERLLKSGFSESDTAELLEIIDEAPYHLKSDWAEVAIAVKQSRSSINMEALEALMNLTN